VWISRKEIEELSKYLRGEVDADIRDNKEGAFSILKNDAYSLVTGKEEQLKSLANQRDILSEYMADISHQLKTP